MQEESLVLIKEHLFHDVVTFDHLKKIDDIEISRELLDALIQIEVCQCALTFLKRVLTLETETSKVVLKRLA